MSFLAKPTRSKWAFILGYYGFADSLENEIHMPGDVITGQFGAFPSGYFHLRFMFHFGV